MGLTGLETPENQQMTLPALCCSWAVLQGRIKAATEWPCWPCSHRTLECFRLEGTFNDPLVQSPHPIAPSLIPSLTTILLLKRSSPKSVSLAQFSEITATVNYLPPSQVPCSGEGLWNGGFYP